MDSDQLLNDPETSLRLALDGRQSQMWTAMPALVTKVNWTAMTLEVQPATMGIITDETGKDSNVKLPLLVDVPICFCGAGNFILTMPVVVGDEVLVIFSSRCIDAWHQQGGVQPQAEFRMHDLSDGFAILGPKSIPNIIPNISQNSAQLRNAAGSVFLEITNSGINIKGNVNVTGTIVASGEITGNSIPLSGHIHPGVTTGGGDTGAPLP